tara:strand:+ start:1736 stop:2155 length:420 start_codon:yes stop_codon:yes gene_type:complete
MKKIILTSIITIITIATTSFATAQAATGLNNNRNKIDSNKKGKPSVNYYTQGKITAITSKAIYIRTSSEKILILLQTPKNLHRSLKIGDYISAWIRKSPKPITHTMPDGTIKKTTVYGYLQNRPKNTPITKRNQKRAYQ